MFDISLKWNQRTGFADWQFQDGGIATASDLDSAVLLSLFTDRVAPPDYKPPAGDRNFDRRGHWSDTYEGRKFGSHLWLLNRAVFAQNTNLVLAARDYCRDALQWLIDDGVAAKIAVEVQRADPNTLAILITITEPVTFRKAAFKYSYVWKQAVS
jgi:phage gp46-like protein